MATDPAARPSADDVVRRLQTAPSGVLPRQNDSAGSASAASCIVSGLQRQGDSAGGASVASSIAGALQRQGDSAGGASVASSILGELQHQNDSVGGQSAASSIGGYLLQRQGDPAGGASAASTIADTHQKQSNSSGEVSVGSDIGTLPGLLPSPAQHGAADEGKQQRPVAVKGEPGFQRHSAGFIELAWFGTKAALMAGSVETGSISPSGAPSFSSVSAGERYSDMPRSFSSVVSAPSSTGALSATVSVAAAAASRSGSQHDTGPLEGGAAHVGAPAARAGLQSASAVVARVGAPADPGTLRSASNVGAYPSRRGVSVARAGEVSSRSFARAAVGLGGNDVYAGAQALPQGSVPPVSPFVASHQTWQRRLPVSPFSEQQ
jgi:hypothetical protein